PCFFAFCLLVVCLLLETAFATASESPEILASRLTKEITALFPDATTIGQKQQDFPVWPVFKGDELLGYAFQSVDLVSFRGWSGHPINMLIGLDTQGKYTGVKVLEHQEPVFRHGLERQALSRFIHQYVSHQVTDRIIVGSGQHGTATIEGKRTAYFDGVSRATVSVVVINDSILSSALQVARRKLGGYGAAGTAAVKEAYFEPLDWPQLLKKGYVKEWRISDRDVEQATGKAFSSFHFDNMVPGESTTDFRIYYAYLNVPSIGRNLLGDLEFERLKASLEQDEHALAIMSTGFYTYIEDHFWPGSVPDRVGLEQQGLPIQIRDINFYNHKTLAMAPQVPGRDNLRVFIIKKESGFNPSLPMSLGINMQLAEAQQAATTARFSDSYQLPEKFFAIPKPKTNLGPNKPWVSIWRSRLPHIIILGIALLILSIAFVKQQAISKQTKNFHRFRWLYLFFTLFFIGFLAQGQLSVVNIYTLLLEIKHGFSLDMFLLDPILFILWSYTAISLALWGRGLFCGWLCPFGALQEMVAWLAEKLRFKQLRVPPALHRQLIKLKYIILGALVIVAFYSSTLANTLAEVEPFKTSITLGFMRPWNFVLYALLILGIGLFIHKFYCRYLCPLGAGLAVIGKLRRFEWLNRRSECGKPCQVCRHKCGINAIDRAGKIDYNECIQCLECIVIINDNEQCAPAIIEQRRSRKQRRDNEVLIYPAEQA
ncbi:4Fe-4S binding protein, partial [Porticoccus sp.]